MKFWELISAFRKENEILESVLEKLEWREYRKNYQNFNTIVKHQNREILDKKIPFKLSMEICTKSKQEFYLYYDRIPIVLTSSKKASEEKFELVSPLDILLRYGGKYIEETLEKSIAEVNSKKIGNDVEVLGAFNLTNIGLVAILRTEDKKLENGEILITKDGNRKWQIINEPLIRMSNYEKLKSQREQGIRHYLIKALNNKAKPIEKEILKRKPNR